MKRRAKQGFSLIEILVAVTVFATAIALVASITTSSLRAIRRSTANKHLNSVVRDFNNLMTNKVRSATWIEPSPTNPDTVIISYKGYKEEIGLDTANHKLTSTISDVTTNLLPDNISVDIAEGATHGLVASDGSMLTLKLRLSSSADDVETDYVTSLVRRN